jgi:hypothetical protein
MTSSFTEESVVRLRTILTSLAITVLGGSAILSSAIVRAQPHHSIRLADAVAPVSRTLYVNGTVVDAAGYPTRLAGLATLTVQDTGSYTGTMTTAGTNAATLAVSGVISGTGAPSSMTLATTYNGQPLAIQARAVVDVVGDRGKTSPLTTVDNEYQGTLTLGNGASGAVTLIDTSIMREYSFAGTVDRGPHRGMILNAGVFVLMDRYAELHGYLLRDSDNALFPLVSATLGRGRMALHVDLVGGGQLIGVAQASRSIRANQVVYKGTFGGPGSSDSGTWLSSPPEQ